MLCTKDVKSDVQKGIYKSVAFEKRVSVCLKSGRPKSRESDWNLRRMYLERRKKQKAHGGGRGPLYEQGD
jgi:hypothetical protein